ncbi:MAG: hemerythrin domain-containing protein [Pseudomonadota bacterium]
MQPKDTGIREEKADRHPLSRLSAQSHRASQVSDLLEALADDLPRRNAPIWREARRLCDAVLRLHYKTMSDILIPHLLDRMSQETEFQDMLSRLRKDYDEEASRLLDLHDLITEALASGYDSIAPDALGYALRSYFEAARRHINWETEVLFPMARRKLNLQDLQEIDRDLSNLGTAGLEATVA